MNFEEFLDSLQNKTVAVIGIGVSNQPLLKLLLDRGIAVTACDKKDRESLGIVAEQLEANGCRLRLGEGYLDDLTEDVIFRTPGMRPDLPQLTAAVERGSTPVRWRYFSRSVPARKSPLPAATARRRPPPSSRSS